MIPIDRNRTDDGKPIQPSKAWFKRSKEATDKALIDQGDHDFDGGIYGHRSVRRALEKLFYEKCAYCETPLARQDWDVDHYRPKGRVNGTAHSGYYWLGYKWQNLFPSCKFCNQRRKDVPMWDDPVAGPGGGKADHFPLGDENHRVNDPDVDITQEMPLLINPCVDEPKEHITFNPLGEVVGLDNKGNKSKELYHLNEKRLRRRRSDRMSEVIVFLKLKRQVSATLGLIPALLEEMETALTEDSAPYAGAARAVMEEPEKFGL